METFTASTFLRWWGREKDGPLTVDEERRAVLQAAELVRQLWLTTPPDTAEWRILLHVRGRLVDRHTILEFRDPPA